MSILAIRCPRCGGSAEPTGKSNEYKCVHCGTEAQFVRPGDGTVVSDSRTHHCPLCGKAVKLLQSFRCTECGTVDFCQTCMCPVANFGVVRYVCRACVAEKGWACPACGGFGASVCVNCGRRACSAHSDGIFGVIHERRDETIVQFYSCPNCGQLCTECIQEKRGLFSRKYYCPKCGVQIHPETERDLQVGFEISEPRREGGEKNA